MASANQDESSKFVTDVRALETSVPEALSPSFSAAISGNNRMPTSTLVALLAPRLKTSSCPTVSLAEIAIHGK
jgi:hypothetical protein